MVNRDWKFLLVSIGLCLTEMMFASVVVAIEPMPAEELLIKPEVERKDMRLAKIDNESLEIGYYTGTMSFEDFGSNSVQGIFMSFHINEDVFLRASYGDTTIGKSTSEVSFPDTELFTDSQRKVTYYNVLVGYNLLPGEVYIGNELAFNTDLYFVVGSGVTKFADDNYATFVYGWGYRFLGADWLSFHLDVRSHSFTHYKFGYEKSVTNLEATIGMAIFF